MCATLRQGLLGQRHMCVHVCVLQASGEGMCGAVRQGLQAVCVVVGGGEHIITAITCF